MPTTSFLLDPNVIYLILIASLWAVVTAIHIPGTGAAEIVALGGLAATLFLLGQVPTQWVSVTLIVVGVLMFLILPLLDGRLLLLGLVGLALQGIGGWFLFTGMQVSPVIMGITLLTGLLYYRFALMPTLATQRSKGQLLEDQSLVGMKGYVQTRIAPVGTVYVHGESWTARRGDDQTDPIDVGAEIIVSEREGLTLFVEPLKHKREPA